MKKKYWTLSACHQSIHYLFDEKFECTVRMYKNIFTVPSYTQKINKTTHKKTVNDLVKFFFFLSIAEGDLHRHNEVQLCMNKIITLTTLFSVFSSSSMLHSKVIYPS